MNDLDFEESLSFGNTRKLAAASWLGSVKEHMQNEAGPLLKRGPDVAAALAGIALLGAAQHHHSKPGKGGAASKEQTHAEESLAKSEALKKSLQEEGREPTYEESVELAAAPARKGIADAMAKHPVKGALHFARQPGTIAAGAALGSLGLHAGKGVVHAGKQLFRKFSSAEKTAVLDMSSMLPAAQGLLAKAKANPGVAGAMAGGVLGGARGLLKNPGVDPRTGQQRSRVGAAVTGAAGGAALGGAVGAAAGHLAGSKARAAVQTRPVRDVPAGTQPSPRPVPVSMNQNVGGGAVPAPGGGTARVAPNISERQRVRNLQGGVDDPRLAQEAAAAVPTGDPSAESVGPVRRMKAASVDFQKVAGLMKERVHAHC